MYLEKLTISSKSEPIPLFGASHEFLSSFQGLVGSHLDLFLWPNQCTHLLFLAKPAADLAPLAYHYFYLSEDKIDCELFAIFVEPTHRSNGLAFQLICDAARHARALGAKSFNLRFIDENASIGKLVKNLQQLAETEFRECNIQFYLERTIWSNQKRA